MIRTAIAAAIARSGLTQAEVARRADMTPPQLSRYLRTGRIRSDVLERLMQALGLTLSHGSDVSQPSDPPGTATRRSSPRTSDR